MRRSRRSIPDRRLLLPLSISSGKPYQGVNVLILWTAALKNLYASPYWGTLKAWNQLDCRVKDGREGMPHRSLDREDRSRSGDRGRGGRVVPGEPPCVQRRPGPGTSGDRSPSSGATSPRSSWCRWMRLRPREHL